MTRSLLAALLALALGPSLHAGLRGGITIKPRYDPRVLAVKEVREELDRIYREHLEQAIRRRQEEAARRAAGQADGRADGRSPRHLPPVQRPKSEFERLREKMARIRDRQPGLRAGPQRGRRGGAARAPRGKHPSGPGPLILTPGN